MTKINIPIKKWYAYPFLILGAVGFLSGFMVSFVFKNTPFELPMGMPSGLVVDSKGNMCVSLEYYSSIQCYNVSGEFVNNWRIPSGGGHVGINIRKDTIQVLATKSDQLVQYTLEGKVISASESNMSRSAFRDNANLFKLEKNKVYQLRGGIITLNDQIVVDNKIYLWMLKGPFPAFLFFVFGVGILVYVRRELALRNAATDNRF